MLKEKSTNRYGTVPTSCTSGKDFCKFLKLVIYLLSVFFCDGLENMWTITFIPAKYQFLHDFNFEENNIIIWRWKLCSFWLGNGVWRNKMPRCLNISACRWSSYPRAPFNHFFPAHLILCVQVRKTTHRNILPKLSWGWSGQRLLEYLCENISSRHL